VRRHPHRGTCDERAGAGGPGPPRVVSAADSVLLPAGLTKLLENAGFDVAATAGEASGCLSRWSVNNQRGPELITQRHSAEVRRADESLHADHRGLRASTKEHLESRGRTWLSASVRFGI
jgi:hypothetical protein